MTHGEWVCSIPRCCGKSGWMTEALLKRGEVLLMTWDDFMAMKECRYRNPIRWANREELDEVRKIAEKLFGPGAMKKTLKEMEEIAASNGKKASDVIKEIEERLQQGESKANAIEQLNCVE